MRLRGRFYDKQSGNAEAYAFVFGCTFVQRDGGVFVLQKMPSFSLPNVDLSERSRLRAGKKMNGLVIILIGIVALGAGYLFYGRWLAKKWGIDPNAKTPAYTHEDGEDYVPSSRFTVFSHQFSSIAGAGPVTGPILASVFGWVPVLFVADHRRSVFRRGTGFRCAICLGQK